MKTKGTLFLIPNSLGSPDPKVYLPEYVIGCAPQFKYYIVENLRNARRYLKSLKSDTNIDAITFYELNKHTNETDLIGFLDPLKRGEDMGLFSEAGLPGVADPGAAIVNLAHQNQIKVVPLTGPSSIFMALMASGFNGQSFRFVGYLPVNRSERIHALKHLEAISRKENETQIFIETPYRNNALLDDLLSVCASETGLTIAVDISIDSEMIRTASIASWRKKRPELHKRPAVFLLGRL